MMYTNFSLDLKDLLRIRTIPFFVGGFEVGYDLLATMVCGMWALRVFSLPFQEAACNAQRTKSN